MILYSALYDMFYPFDVFYPEAERITLHAGMSPTRNDGWLIIWGGSDIHPSQYNRPIDGSNVNILPTKRDLEEERMLRVAASIGLRTLGVCRGAQLACAVAGGVLAQHVSGHTQSHVIETRDSRKLVTSSLHHQMMYPWNVEHELVAWTKRRSVTYRGLTQEEVTEMHNHPEPEVVWFPTIQTLAIQGHPEFMRRTDEFNGAVHGWMREYERNS